ncbi:acyl-CoA dehydrogenase family protein [Conexibacter arvalis]|uniref:Alkylation response protein AidB-like acyl-CoA dehydrogenase n=1 Tax=Conexibacter arvalis TaxID=912552 RepID=A0A840I8B1_9ACTN|nr:acyl-CoA dehydrogenase family protein [Conexibacter arvalis]MBB4660511.1 alkylation response protein AidB-like acyl-CoA dehydrogenase [Conexibacter arvalis]
MDLTFDEHEAAFRDELRAWLEVNRPGPEPAGEDARWAWRMDWHRRLASGRWAGVHWPVEYGGRGATYTQSAIFFEELGRAGAPLPGDALGLLLAGPTLMAWGSEELRQRLLPTILAGSEPWCQGFSEPDAGSDLAALRTKATRDGDEWVIEGQKVWTSNAQYAKWCMLIARTGSDSPKKHHGLTYFVMDMEQPGLQIRPLRQITGESEFNELFIEGARVPHDHVVGGVGNGWKVTLTTLMNERAGLGFFLQVRLRQQVDALAAEAAARGLLDDPRVADRLGDLHMRAEAIRLTAYRGLTSTEKHGQPGPEGSVTKWMWSEASQELAQLAVDVLGPDALVEGTAWAHELLRSRGNSIEGGTTEVLKNIVAERVLGLPRR